MNKETLNQNVTSPDGADGAEVERVMETTQTTKADGEQGVTISETSERSMSSFRPLRNRNIAIVALFAAFALFAILFLWSRRESAEANVAVKAADEHVAGEEPAGEANEVKLEPEALTAARIEIEGVTQRPAVALLRVTGTIEANPQQTQQVTPLIGGRVERVNVAVGDRVGTGSVLATIASPQIAQMHGKLHEAQTAYELAKRNLSRVQRAENRVAVLSAKARLDEAEATLKRTRRLIELGAGAGKDLISAETAYKTAKADFDFQSNISLNRELQEAQAAVETTRVDVGHIRDEMRALGAPVPNGDDDDHRHNTSLVTLRAPASGIITERGVNSGAGVEAGKSLFTISNLSSVYVIANVPEAQIGTLRVGTPAEIRSAALGEGVLRGRVSYIDPQLDEATRTARARIEVQNPGERLRAGTFVEVGFQTTTGAGGGAAAGEELVIPASAVQRIENKPVVFVPKEDEPGVFEVREVELGGEADGYVRILEGLKMGERIVTRGSFTLKTQMQKGAMGDDDH
jgi:cobalt-zinc-cadmium efflux system membrane fusion protein